jgi:hypothetical protein
MWVVYHVDTLDVLGKFHIKRKAKAKRDRITGTAYYKYAIDKVEIAKYDSWLMWKILQCKS